MSLYRLVVRVQPPFFRNLAGSSSGSALLLFLKPLTDARTSENMGGSPSSCAGGRISEFG